MKPDMCQKTSDAQKKSVEELKSNIVKKMKEIENNLYDISRWYDANKQIQDFVNRNWCFPGIPKELYKYAHTTAENLRDDTVRIFPIKDNLQITIRQNIEQVVLERIKSDFVLCSIGFNKIEQLRDIDFDSITICSTEITRGLFECILECYDEVVKPEYQCTDDGLKYCINPYARTINIIQYNIEQEFTFDEFMKTIETALRAKENETIYAKNLELKRQHIEQIAADL